ncbi:MAG: hypothetical protein ACYC6Y_24535 [Thermoguttaceae bacterium]
MSIWNKILLGCIAVTALALFVLSARALQAHRVWRESYNKHVEAIAAAEIKAKELVDGNAEAKQKGLRQAKLDLYKILIGRGRVWDNVIPVKVEKGPDPGTDPPQQRVLITLQTEQPDAIEAKAVFFAFQVQPPAAAEGQPADLAPDAQPADAPSEGQQPGAAAQRSVYLGQFSVDQVGGNQIIIHPSLRLSDSEFARVQDSQKNQMPWRLYELMPTDDHEVLRSLTDQQKQALFADTTPGDEEYSTVADYLSDGQIMTRQEAETKNLHGKVVAVDEAGNPVRNQEGLYTEVTDGKGMFIRTLRDYEVYFAEGHRLRAMIIDRIRAAQRDLQFLRESLEDSRQQRQATQNEITSLGQQLAKAVQERDMVLQHEARLDAAIASMQKVVADLVARNEATLAQVASIQTEAARVISARTAGVVQATPRPATAP